MTSPADAEHGIAEGYLAACEAENRRLRQQNAALRGAMAEWTRRHTGLGWHCTACEVLRREGAALAEAEQP